MTPRDPTACEVCGSESPRDARLCGDCAEIAMASPFDRAPWQGKHDRPDSALH